MMTRRRCCCAGTPVYPCGTCSIPKANLTVSWTNLILGNGSTTLVYSSSPSTVWASGCSNQLLYKVSCVGGVLVFQVTYFISGSCPTGQAQTCQTGSTNPHKLTTTSQVCGASFLWVIGLTSTTCPTLSAFGYTGFTVSI